MSLAREVFIVSGQRPDLYERLRREFEGKHHVEVIIDRRRGERRRAEAHAEGADRRRIDRRAREEVALLRTLGVTAISYPLPPR